jgi:hypothetical protein
VVYGPSVQPNSNRSSIAVIHVVYDVIHWILHRFAQIFFENVVCANFCLREFCFCAFGLREFLIVLNITPEGALIQCITC